MTKSQRQILSGVLIGITMNELIRVRPMQTKYDHLLRLSVALAQDITEVNAQMAYMVDLLNQNNVQLDEFDLIALPGVKKRD